MVDVTQICNQALAAVGTRTSISSISEQSNEARQCLLQYDSTRRHLLRAAHWGFARSYWAPALLKARRGTPEAASNPPPPSPDSGWDIVNEPPPPWLYAYSIGGGAILAVRYVLPASATGIGISPPIFGTTAQSYDPEMWSGPSVKFEIGTIATQGPPDWIITPALLTNMPRAIICYTRDMTDTNLFDESFMRAFVQALAANIVTALTGDLKLYDALLKTANSMIIEARVRSANESLNAIDIMPDWFRVRGAGPSVGTGPWVAEFGPLFGGVM